MDPSPPYIINNMNMNMNSEEQSFSYSPSDAVKEKMKRDHAARMKRAKEIAQRYDERGQALPRFPNAKQSVKSQLEYKDADKLKYWRSAYLAKNTSQCPPELVEFLDSRMPGWRAVKSTSKALTASEQMELATSIVKRYQERGRVLPKELRKHNDTERALEYKDAQKLSKWKQALRGSKHGHACAPEVQKYLDAEMPGWDKNVNSKSHNASYIQMEKARNIVARFKARGNVIPRHLSNRSNPEHAQEHKDAQKLNDWKQALMKPNRGQCPAELKDYLDQEMPGWRTYVKSHKGVASEHQMQMARDVTERYLARGKVLPRQWKDRSDPQRYQEYKDALRLSNWKKLGTKRKRKGEGSDENLNCDSQSSDDILEYLDANMTGWRDSMRENSSDSRSSSPLEDNTEHNDFNNNVSGHIDECENESAVKIKKVRTESSQDEGEGEGSFSCGEGMILSSSQDQTLFLLRNNEIITAQTTGGGQNHQGVMSSPTVARI